MMARRFGGKYSPPPPPGVDAPDDGAAAPLAGRDDPAAAAGGFRAKLLFVLPLPFVLKAFWSPPSALFVNLIAAGLLLAGAWLTREGLRAESAYRARSLARRPAFPRKIAGALATGMGLLMAATMITINPLMHVLFGAFGAGLHLAAFGLDPLVDKGMGGGGGDGFQAERVARAVNEAEAYLAAMTGAVAGLGEPLIAARVERFATVARQLFRRVEADPGDLTAARKYLSVYLMGARDATVKFASLWTASRSKAARADYEALLSDLEANFAQRSLALLGDDHSDLDVEIKVLRARLKMNV